MIYSQDAHFIYLEKTPYDLKDRIKEQLNGVWISNKNRKGWRFPKNVFVYRELYKHFPELRANTQFIEDGITAAQSDIFWKDMKASDGLSWDGLRPYQNQDVHYLTERGSCLVLNEPRTGKTPTMIKTLTALQSKVNIVICPSSLVYNWAKEFEKWDPEIETHIVNGTAKKREAIYGLFSTKYGKTRKVLIVSKDTFKKDSDLHEMKFDAAIVDEAHFLRNYKTAQSKAIFGLKANVKYALTGTPSVKHSADVYGLLHFINPDAFPSYWQFADRYFYIDESHWGKSIGTAKGYRSDELRKLMSLNSVQRKRKDIMKWLPEATRQTIPLVMDKKQVKLYDQMFDTFMASAEDVEVDTMNKLTQLLRLRQLCLDPRLLGFDVVGVKTTALLEFVENNPDPLVVMTTFSSYFKLIKPDLEKLGKNVGVIDGSTSKPMRQKYVEWFQSGKIDILLCNIIAAGTGLTLDRADTILFLDKDFNPANNEQAEDRIVPTTKERYHPINIISLVCQGTTDERVNEILENKEDLTKLINKPEVFA